MRPSSSPAGWVDSTDGIIDISDLETVFSDGYRRFIQMFSDVVMEVGKKYFEQLIDKMKEERGVKFDIDLTAADLKELAYTLLCNVDKYIFRFS